MPKVQEAISEILSSGYQIQPDAFELLKNIDREYDVVQLVKTVISGKNVVKAVKLITKDDIEEFLGKPVIVDMSSIEEVDCEISVISDSHLSKDLVEGVDGYKALFSSRFSKLMKIVKQRQDSSQIQKIAHVGSNNNKPVKIAGFLIDRKIKKGGTEVVIDDDTGKLTVYAADVGVEKRITELLLDQLVIADIISNKQGSFVVKNIHSPDMPDRVVNASKKNAYVIFTSDLHIGSDKFLARPFEKFIAWLSGQSGDLDIVKRVVCLVIGGDSIDGGSIHSDLRKDSMQQDVFTQYEILSNYLRLLPKHIKIIIIPGEHDVTRGALPQPPIPKYFAGNLYKVENIRVLGNPSQFIINGVNIISYHGSSLDDVTATVSGLSISKPAQAMKVLLRVRHLAPYYGGATQIAPEIEDRLVIDQVPDVFHAGHLHVVDLDSYRGSVILNSGTWQAQTVYQEMMGIDPTPGIVPVLNLSNLEVIVKNFLT